MCRCALHRKVDFHCFYALFLEHQTVSKIKTQQIASDIATLFSLLFWFFRFCFELLHHLFSFFFFCFLFCFFIH